MKAQTIIGLATLCAVVVYAPSTFACGGLFCSTSSAVPSPVDQTAERIVFEVGDGEITTHVQIQYAGAAEQFAWIVPVPNVPEVAESSDEFINEIDTLTAPQVQAPINETCPGAVQPSFGSSGGSGCGLGCSSDDSTLSADGGSDPQNKLEDPVTVHERSYTDNFEFVTISAEQSSDLVTWLQDNNYNVSDNMIPVMQPYVDGGMVFLGLKLRDGKSASDIVPIKMTYTAENPMIPIQLTAVAAQPHMGIIAMVISDDYFKADNVVELPVKTEEILYDINGRTNYFDWVARQIAEREGQAVVIEAAMLRGTEKVTRFYTRLSPQHMTTDPAFSPAPNREPVSPIIDLSANPSIQCTDFSQLILVDARQPAACAFNYCGVGATCYDIDNIAHCQCPDGAVAQRVAGPDGSPRVSCEPSENAFGILPEAGGVGTTFDPCNSTQCGSGTCVLKAGFPTCACEEGAVACLNDTGNVECVTADLNIPSFGPGAGVESAGSNTPLEELKQFEGEKAAGTALFFLLAFCGWRVRRQATRS